MSCNWAKDGSFSEQDISRESSLLPGPLWIFFTNFHKEPFTVWQFLGKSEKFSKFLRTQTVWFARLKHSRIYEEAEESDHFQHQLQFHPKKWYNCVWKSTGFSNELLNSFETFQRQVDWKLFKCQTSDWTFEIKNTIPRCGVKDQQDIKTDQDPVQVRIQNHVITVICKLNLTGVHISTRLFWRLKKQPSNLLFLIPVPEGWLTVAPHLQTTPSEERLCVWQFLSPGHHGYLRWRNSNIWSRILAARQVELSRMMRDERCLHHSYLLVCTFEYKLAFHSYRLIYPT